MNKKNIIALSALTYCLSVYAEVPEAETAPTAVLQQAGQTEESENSQVSNKTCPPLVADCAACPMPEKIKRKEDKPQIAQFQINPRKFPRYLECLKKFASLVKSCAHNVNELRKTEEFGKIKADLKEIVQIIKLMAPQIAAAKAQLLKVSGSVDANLQEITELRKVNIEVDPLLNLVKAFNIFANQTVDTLDQFAQEVNNNKQLQELLA